MNPIAINLLARRISDEALHTIRADLESRGFHFDSATRILDDTFQRIELIGTAQRAITSEIPELLDKSSKLGVDISFEDAQAYRTPKKLLLMDIDSTLIRNEVINELAAEKGNFNEVAAITELSMQGKINFDQSITQRVLTFRGLKASHLTNILPRIRYTEGAQDLIKVARRLGMKVGLISGGFNFMADRLKEDLALDYAFANQLEIQDGTLTGRIIPPLLNAQKKADILQSLAQKEGISLLEVVAVGDGANDIPMIETAGLGIAFNAKPILRPHANLALNDRSLFAVAYVLVHSQDELARVTT